MKIKDSFVLLLGIILFSGCRQQAELERATVSFDNDWLFHQDDVPDGEKRVLDDSGWRRLDVPHDWSIEDIPGTGSPFDSTVVNGVSSGFVRGGTGWYRKHFTVGQSDAPRRFFIQFDGVYMNSEVWVNEKPVGNHFYGYTSFGFDITDFIEPGKENLIAVRVENESVKCRWYSGSGIYRHVWLTTMNPVHVDQWGTAVTTPDVTEQKAAVAVSTTLNNTDTGDQEVKIRYTVRNKENQAVAQGETTGTVPGEKKETLNAQLTVEAPTLWSTDAPYLYSLETEVLVNNKRVDRVTESFGIRTIQFDAEHGFRLNGKPLELKGGCIHHDNGPLGAVALDRAEERKVELHKAAGYNAFRMAHNPPSPAMLAACDRLGMLVIDEAFDVWSYGHYDGDYGTHFHQLWQSDLASMVLRDRNHPSVIMWSIGNEILKTETEELVQRCREMGDFVRAIDPTRPVTGGVNSITEARFPYLSELDVCGYNYCLGRYETDHQKNPDWVMYGSESYASEAYDFWKAVEKYPWVIGDFVWTSFDYIGEVSIGWRGYPLEPDAFPWNLAYCGDIGICGDRRSPSYYRQTLWSDEPMTYITVTPPTPSFPLNPKKEKWSVWDWADEIPCWNFEGYETKPLSVNVYSRCDEVELFLNGESAGKQKNVPEKNKNILRWNVPYQMGELKAVGFNNGKEVTSSVLKTAGKPVKIVLTPDRTLIAADGQDLSYIKIELVDANGIKNPVADNLIHFELSGPGKLAAVGNSNPVSTESFQKPYRKAWRGECLAIIRAGREAGSIRLAVKADGMESAEISINAE